MDLQSISVLVSKIERYLHDEYKGANKEYKVSFFTVWGQMELHDYFFKM